MSGRRSLDALKAKREARGQLTETAPVMEAAAVFLAARPRSISETERRLRHLGYPAQLVDEVVARLIELGYLDDDAFARTWVESRDRARPRGESALRRELVLKGVTREVIDEVLGERQEAATETGPERAAAAELLARKSVLLEREPDRRKRRQRAYALLARAGFDPETCRDVSAAVLGERPEDNVGDEDQ